MAIITFDNEYFMRQALIEAEYAKQENEIPIGCVIVCNGKIIARGHNMTERLTDSTSHAEIIAITSAEEYLQSKYLKDCTLYVTIEPCLMCAGAIMWSQISHIVYGAKDEKRGFSSYVCNYKAESGQNSTHHALFSDKVKIEGGVLEKECRELMQNFFKNKRK